MASEFSKELLKIVVAQICHTIGWHSVMDTPLEVMTDILDKHLRDVCNGTKRNCELAGRTLPHVADVHLALQQLSTDMQEVSEYLANVQPLTLPLQVSEYPMACDSHLQVRELT